jgi:ABC-2 type transport system ATP-binding protein
MSTLEPLLECSQLRKRFAARQAVADLSLRVEAGELVALTGPNGSGKSTALRMLAGLVKFDSGSGQVLGCSLQGIDRQTRNAIGYLPQRAALYANLSVFENLRFRAAVAGLVRPAESARRCIEALGLTPRSHEMLSAFSGG